MALSEFEKKRVEKLLTAYCENKIPPDLRDQIRIEFRIRGNEVNGTGGRSCLATFCMASTIGHEKIPLHPLESPFFPTLPGMQTHAAIHPGGRTVFSPVSKARHGAGRER